MTGTRDLPGLLLFGCCALLCAGLATGEASAQQPCSDTFPECGGTCPNAGEVCLQEPVNETCFCQQVEPTCSQSPYPTCDGACGPNETCEQVDGADVCRCVPAVVDCEQGPFPECGGECPPDQVCTGNALNECVCEPIGPVACEQGPFPECGGECPPDQVCTAIDDLDECVCEPIVIPCDQSPHPECGGECPPDQVCEPLALAAICGCVPIVVPCEQSPHPECGGECPPDQECRPSTDGTDACHCELIAPVACEQGPFPECGGECPLDQICTGNEALNECVCVPLVVACEQSPFPVCDGECPPNTHCESASTTVILPSPQLPPESNPPDCDRVVSMYEGQDVHALFPGGIDFSNPQHKCFINVNRQDDGLGNEIETFDSTVDAQVDLGGGPVPVSLSGPVTIVTYGKTGNTTGTFATEMVSMSLTGNVAGVPVEVRESPSLASTGQTTITDLGGGLWQIDSFFDVFTELSVDGGPFQPQTNPAGRMRLVPVDAGSCECVSDQLPCDLSDPLTCDGPCPNATDVCTPDSTGGPCFCAPPPVECELSPYPECGGECPPDQVCEPDASGLDNCNCVPVGQECSQCGPGPHFIDQCGPFPPVGTDLVATNGALVGIDVDMDCVRDVSLVLHPCPAPDQLLHIDKTLGPIDDSMHFPGVSPVDGHPTGPGLDVIDTEIIAMCLTDGNVTLAAGVGGPSAMPLQPSLGTLAEDLTTPDPAWVDSFFDVFFEVSGIPGGPVYNETPLRVESRIDCLPPAAGYRNPTGICIPLTTRGFCDTGPNGGNPCLGDQDCPDAFCIGKQTLVNLVSALHTVNVPVCDNSPYPECGGECPPDEECRPSLDGTDACRCEPIGPAPCEQGPFPECGGECPPDQVCMGDAALNECVCAPIVESCAQSPHPECGGECPPDQVCEPIAGAVACACVPIVVACEQGPFPECGGECPPDQVCTADAELDECVCEPIVVECETAPHPTCDGECPPDQICLSAPDGSKACVCEPIVIPCDQGPFPECGGECPPDLICEPDPDGDDLCRCVPPPVRCEDSDPPVCDGFCPDPQQETCVHLPGTNDCDCRPCLVNVPGHDIELLFVSHDQLRWIGVPCAFVYNVYRFAGPRHVDADADGLADDYGSCLLHDLLVTGALDTSVPPEGSLLAYLVTGENSVGEGSMGFASNMLQRPNNNPCP